MDLLQKVFCIVSSGLCDCNGSSGPQSHPSGLAVQWSHCLKDLGFLPCPSPTHPGANTPILVGHFKRSKLFKDLWGEANSLIQFHHFSERYFSWQDDSYMINVSAREREREYVSHASGSLSASDITLSLQWPMQSKLSSDRLSKETRSLAEWRLELVLSEERTVWLSKVKSSS